MRLLQRIWRLEPALEIVAQHLTKQGSVTLVDLLQSVGRIAAEDIVATEPVPHFVRSTMDGYAVIAQATFGASEGLPALLSLGSKGLDACVPVLTGGAIPAGFDAVVMLEYTEQLEDGMVLVSRPVATGENVMSIGEDVAIGTVLVKKGSVISIRDIALLSALGCTKIPVRDFRVALLSSGDEVVPASQVPSTGQVRDINSAMLASLFCSLGLSPQFLGIVPDNEARLTQVLGQALREYDAVVMSGGSSAGSLDFTARSIESLGIPGVLVHGLSIKPGKPTVLGVVEGKLVLGLPGHPLSCSLTAHVVAAPLLASAAEAKLNSRTKVPAKLTRPIASAPGRRDFIPVRLTEDGVTPLMAKSAAIRVMAESDGFIEIHEDCEGLQAGENVAVQMWR